MAFTAVHAASVKERAASGFRSKLEKELAQALTIAQIPYRYEAARIPYVIPANYLPDFILIDQAIIIETKGVFDAPDRSKMIRVKAAHPDLDIRFLFSNPKTRIFKTSTTTYGMWCEKHGFPYAKGGTPPPEWLTHKPTQKQKEALLRILNGT